MQISSTINVIFCCDFRIIDTAASQLTKTAITVTTIFIVALRYDLWYYILGHLRVTEYIYNSPKQKYGNEAQLMLKFFREEGKKKKLLLPKWLLAEFKNVTMGNVTVTSWQQEKNGVIIYKSLVDNLICTKMN